jgi:hypothetical protein
VPMAISAAAITAVKNNDEWQTTINPTGSSSIYTRGSAIRRPIHQHFKRHISGPIFVKKTVPARLRERRLVKWSWCESESDNGSIRARLFKATVRCRLCTYSCPIPPRRTARNIFVFIEWIVSFLFNVK